MSKIRDILNKKYGAYLGHPLLLSEEDVIECMIEYAEVYAKKVLEVIADNAVTFLPVHKHLHGTKNIDRGSIIFIELPPHT